MLSNIYLHYALDLWFDKIVKPRLKGEAQLIRYLDDFVVCFQYRSDAIRFQSALVKRLAKFDLELENSKTKLFEFGRFEKRESRKKGVRSPTFCFLGFRFYGLCLITGQYVVATVVDGKRRNAFVNRLTESMRAMQHRTLRDQSNSINAKLRGYFNYFGVPFNSRRLNAIRYAVVKYWKDLLGKRNQNGKKNWVDFNRILQHNPIVIPTIRFSRREFDCLWQS